jgi:lysophospholipid acyltransferase (LPLAT)-like uncharacterized protein
MGAAPENGSPHAPGLLERRVVPALAATLVRALRRTMRIRHLERHHLEDRQREGRNVILAFWHGRLLMMPYCYRGDRMAILISRHRDGEMIARTMSWFGHEAIRGSSTRGGASALRAVVRVLRRGGDVAFTPDGPRGPRHRVQGGVIQAARLSGVPIVPVTFSAYPAKIFASWDGFLLPRPFSRGVFLYGPPMEVRRDAGGEEIEACRERLESRMREMTERADRLVRRGDEKP